jgi:hypothetical protein
MRFMCFPHRTRLCVCTPQITWHQHQVWGSNRSRLAVYIHSLAIYRHRPASTYICFASDCVLLYLQFIATTAKLS